MLLFKVSFTISILLMLCDGEKISLEKIYKNGVEAYLREDWTECVVQFEESLNLYKLYKAIINSCRQKCKSFPYKYHIKEDMEDLKIYERFFHINNCLMTCQDTELEKVSLKSNIPDAVLSKMMNLQPYEFLHICYYQTNHLEKATNAAATYLIAHRDDKVMLSNLQQYLELSKMNTYDLVNLEAEKYMLLYDLALKTYSEKKWSQTIDHIEAAIKNYMTSEDNCRAECDQLPEQEWAQEFIMTISNAISSLLSCRQHCQTKLKAIEYDTGEEFLAQALNYLQISYYNIEKFDNAAQATETYLSLKPDDQNMLANKKIYLGLADDTSFVPRSDIMYYIKRDTYEKDLIKLYLEEHNDIYNSNII